MSTPRSQRHGPPLAALWLSILALFGIPGECLPAQEVERVAATVVLMSDDPSQVGACTAALVRHPLLRRAEITTLRFIDPGVVATLRPSGPVIMVGTMKGLLRSFFEGAGLPPGAEPRGGEALAAIIASPWDPNQPMMLVAGAGALEAIDYLASGHMPRRTEFELRRDDMKVRVGSLVARSGVPGRRAPMPDEDLRPLLREAAVGPVRVHWIEGETAASEARAAAERVHRLLLSFAGVIGCEGNGEGERPPRQNAQAVRLFLHETRHAKALRTGDPRETHAFLSPGRTPLVHVVHPSAGARLPAEGIARAALRLCGDDGLEETLAQGVAAYLAGSVMGKDLEWWETRLAGLGEAGDAGGEGSWLVRTAVVALQVRRLLAGAERGSLGRILASGRDLTPPSPLQGDRQPAPRPKVRAAIPFQKGMTLAHEGYAVVDGYGSTSSASQMSRLKGLGVEWIALVPYAFMGDPALPRIEFHRSERQGSGTENDFAIAADVAAAHALGLKVMLKPQIWLGRGAWPGDIAMTSHEDWRAFFAQYRAFLTHYALLASATEADLLVVGVELVKATAQRPDDWRALIGHARTLYDGPVTYAANWGEEVESILFWDRLDFIGVDCYYPLSADPKADDNELRMGANEIARTLERISARAGRPVLLTEAGFPALASAWVSPHDDRGDRPCNPDDQARGYRILLDALWSRPWLAGIYWWKWPTADTDGRGGRERFSPRGLPAERLVAEWYRLKRANPVHWTSPIRNMD